MNDNLRRSWVKYEIIDNLKNNLFFFNQLSSIYKYGSFVFNYFKMKENRIFKQKHSNETCYILGNGISLDEIDIEMINQKKVFACNEIYFHRKFHQLKIDYYTVMEPFYGRILGRTVLEESVKMYKEIDNAFADKKTILFFPPSIKQLLGRNNLLKNNRIHYVASLSSKKLSKQQSNDLAGVFNFGQGALSFMIAASIYMGFKKIVLFGCGYSYAPRQEFHFYARPFYLKIEYNFEMMLKKAEEYAKHAGLSIKEIKETEDKYLPVFTSTFSRDQTALQYIHLNDFATENNVEIINIYPTGFESPIFNGLTWEQYQQSTINQ